MALVNAAEDTKCIEINCGSRVQSISYQAALTEKKFKINIKTPESEEEKYFDCDRCAMYHFFCLSTPPDAALTIKTLYNKSDNGYRF